MSAINGDKGRHDRQRKARMHDRERIREIRKALEQPSPKQASKTKTK